MFIGLSDVWTQESTFSMRKLRKEDSYIDPEASADGNLNEIRFE